MYKNTIHAYTAGILYILYILYIGTIGTRI